MHNVIYIMDGVSVHTFILSTEECDMRNKQFRVCDNFVWPLLEVTLQNHCGHFPRLKLQGFELVP